MQFGARSVANNPTRRFLFPGYADATAPTDEIQISLPRDGTLRNLVVRWRTVGGNNNTLSFIVRVNAVDTAIVATAAANAPARFAADLVNSVFALQSDFVSIAVDKSGNINGSPLDVQAALEVA